MNAKILIAAAAALLLGAAAPASAALLDGNDIAVYLHSLDTLGNTIDGASATVTAPDTAFVDGTLLSATYADKQITVSEYLDGSFVTFFTSGLFSGTPFVTNGLEFFSALLPPGFTSVTIDPASTVAGASVTFSANLIDLNLAGLTLNGGDKIILDLNGGPGGGVPEPASWALMIAGFGIAGAAMRRRNGLSRAAA